MGGGGPVRVGTSEPGRAHPAGAATPGEGPGSLSHANYPSKLLLQMGGGHEAGALPSPCTR